MTARVGSAVAFLVAAIAAACGAGDRIVGDDSPASTSLPSEPAGSSAPNATPKPPPDGDAGVDADAASDEKPDAGEGGSCAAIPPPVAGACGGATAVPTYDAKTACVNGYACPPIGCVAAGGGCVALSPGSCKTAHIGDATKYSCGPGLGVMCCLP